MSHHYYATHAMGWVTAETKDAAIEKLMLQNTDSKWVNNCLKDGSPLTFFVCRVPLAEEAHYQIEWYVPQVDGLTETENRLVTYLTKTKYATCRDPADEIKKLNRQLAEFESAVDDTPETKAAMTAVLAAASDYADVCIADHSLTDQEIAGIMLSINHLSGVSQS